MMFTIEEADDYFELHLKYDFWKSLDQQTKNAALQCAENDIKNFLALECIDETSVFAYCAVLEQAVYLAEYFDVLNSPRELKAESVDGVGKKSYAARNRSLIAPRAALSLDRLYMPARWNRG